MALTGLIKSGFFCVKSSFNKKHNFLIIHMLKMIKCVKLSYRFIDLKQDIE
jgi:hypothetical protein